MKCCKMIMGAMLCVAMLVSMGLPAMADDTSATMNILNYNVDTVVLPTTLKIALNPSGYGVTTQWTRATGFTAGKVYYTKAADGTYSVATTQPTSSTDFTTTEVYLPNSVTDQVVSLNYGIANKATKDKTVKIDFKVDYTASADTTKKAITFVDSATKVAAYDEDSNAEGAKSGELKMFLAVAAASATPTAQTYAKAGSTYSSSATYYTESSGTYTKATVADQDALDAGTFYEETTTIGTLITGAQLSDVTMTRATDGVKAFEEDSTVKAKASIAFKLDKATYALKSGEVIDFTTDKEALASKLELSAIGGVTGFTITGGFNDDADWSQANATSMTITPTYTITDASGNEAPIANTCCEVNLGPSLSFVNATGTITVSGLSSDYQFKSLTFKYTNGTVYNPVTQTNIGTWSPSAPTTATTGTVSLTLASNWITNMRGYDSEVILTYTSGGVDQTLKGTLSIPSA